MIPNPTLPVSSSDPFAPFRPIYELIFGGNAGTGGTSTVLQVHATLASFVQAAPSALIDFYAQFAVFAFFFSCVMVFVIAHYVSKMNAIRAKMMENILPGDASEAANLDVVSAENPKWKLVQDHINSADAAQWRLAILEADIMLADLLDSMHLPGDTIGEKLKAVDTGDFKALEKAWEGHKIRNAIAHEGSDFLLTQREAKRIITLYQSVFEEFEVIPEQ